jgi:hypothetical protein
VKFKIESEIESGIESLLKIVLRAQVSIIRLKEPYKFDRPEIESLSMISFYHS